MPSRIMSPFGTISFDSGEHDNMIEWVFSQAQEAGQKPVKSWVLLTGRRKKTRPATEPG